MAVTSAQVAVSTTAVALNTDTDSVGGTVLWVRNTDAAAVLAFGGSGVTTATGFRIGPVTTVGPIELSTGEVLFAIASAAGPFTVDVLRLGA